MEPQESPKPSQPVPLPVVPGYFIEAVIGRGSTGVVYRATQLAVDRKVAVKVLHRELSTRGRAVRRLQREARTTAKLAHPGIVTAIDMGQTNGLWWYAMELVDGPSLSEHLRKQGVMAERDALRVFIPLCEALEHAFEQGVVHRDIKPGNILIDSTGRARLVDLGLAFAEDDPMLTAQGGTLGTPHYISPEQARNPQSADVKSDIWSLGATMFHCLCGRPPFAGESVGEILSGVLYGRIPDPGSLAPELSKSMRLVLRKCLTRNPERRYQHPRELREDLERIRERRAVSVRRASLDPVAGAMTAQQQGTLIGAGVLAVALAGWLAWEQPWRVEENTQSTASVAQRYEPLESLALKARGNKVQLAGGLAELETLRLEIPAEHEPRLREIATELGRRYNEATHTLRASFWSELERARRERDFVTAFALADGLEQRLKAELNPNATQLAELKQRFELTVRRGELERDLRTALAQIERRAKDYFHDVVARSAATQTQRGEWRSARDGLSLSASELLERCGAPTQGLPAEERSNLVDLLQRWLIDDNLASLDQRWKTFDAELASEIDARANALAIELDARRASDVAASLHAAWDHLRARVGLTDAQMLRDIANTAETRLAVRAAELEAAERANDQLDAQRLLEDKRAGVADLWGQREYEELARFWREAEQLEYLRPVLREIAAERLEAELLHDVLVRAAKRISELLRTRERVEIVLASIARTGVLESASDPLTAAVRFAPGDVATQPQLLSLRAVPGVRTTLFPRATVEAWAGLSATSPDPRERLAYAAFRWREGERGGVLNLGAIPEGALADLAALIEERYEQDASARDRRLADRRTQAERLLQLVNKVERERRYGNESKETVRRIVELLADYLDLPEVAAREAELLRLKAELEKPPGPTTKQDFVESFGPTEVLQFDAATKRVKLRFDFGPTYAGAWSRGAWVTHPDGWQSNRMHDRDELTREDLWPRLVLRSPLDLNGAMTLELEIEQPRGEGLPKLFAVTIAGVHVVFQGSSDLGRPGRCKIATGGPEDFARLLDDVLAGQGTEFDGLEREQRHSIKIELRQSRGAVVVSLDGKPLQADAPKRPDARFDAGTASIVLRSFEPVRVLEATLSGRAQ